MAEPARAPRLPNPYPQTWASRDKGIVSRMWLSLSRRLSKASRCQIALLILVIALVAFISPLAAFFSNRHSTDADTGGADNITDIPVEPTWFVSRSQWLALPPKKVTLLTAPQRRAIIAHTATEECHTRGDCILSVRNMQKIHMNTKGFDDIAYNFLVGGDGRVYEGRGWGVQGSHTKSCNTECLGVAFIGDYRSNVTNSKLTDDQVKYMNRLLNEGLDNGSLITNYTIIPHCQARDFESPGDNIFKVMIHWPRYSATDGGFNIVCPWS